MNKEDNDLPVGCLIIIGVIVFIILVGISVMKNKHCRDKYGEGWTSEGLYTRYCTNRSGEIKGF